jgi:2-iminoacetate synthase
MFVETLSKLNNQIEKVGMLKPIGRTTLQRLLEKSTRGTILESKEIIDILNGTIDDNNRKLILDFSANYKRPHNTEILLLPPLYISSICENKCRYCNFPKSEGVRLSYSEFINEFNALIKLGYRSIELVSGQDPQLFKRANYFNMENQKFIIENTLKYFKLAKKELNSYGGGMLTSNIPPLDIESFKKLNKAGLDCYLTWLETFNHFQYKQLHFQEGPKMNQNFRLNSLEMALKAGIKHVAGAFLKGLYDWKKETVSLYLLDSYLKSKFSRGFSIIGTPRLKRSLIKSKLVKQYLVNNEDFELSMALDRILFDGISWLQTRESFEFNRKLINKYGGGVILTLTCSTAPGGYYKSTSAESQFPIYKQGLSESIKKLEQDGYRIIFDWDSETLSAFQRKQ